MTVEFMDRFMSWVHDENAIWVHMGPQAREALGMPAFQPLPFIRGASLPELKHWLSGSRRPVHCLPYEAMPLLEDMAREYTDLRILCPPQRIKAKFDDRAFVRDMLPRIGVRTLRGEGAQLDVLDFRACTEHYGVPFAIQFPYRTGKEVHAVTDPRDLKSLKEKFGGIPVHVTVYAAGPFINTHAVILEDRRGLHVLAGPLSVEFRGNRETSPAGITPIGSDFRAMERIPLARLIEIQQLARRIGKWMAEQGYRGLYGADFSVGDHATLVALRPSLQPSTSLVTQLCYERKEALHLAAHMAQFFPSAPRPTPRERSRQYELSFVPLKGSQLILYNDGSENLRVTNSLREGVYRPGAGAPRYIRPGASISELKDEQEFLILCGSPGRAELFDPGARLITLQARTSFFAPDLKNLTPRFRGLCDELIRTLNPKPEKGLVADSALLYTNSDT
ncbi:MAG: hypothetical protein HYY14_04320 [Candidatus Omnitrophica bacterium]|nr:hypothetical protein [Candidatus Omnitrophota bacterium]